MNSTIITSELDPSWSIKSYPNGYFYFRTGNEDAIEPMHVPMAVRNEIGPKARALIVPSHFEKIMDEWATLAEFRRR